MLKEIIENSLKQNEAGKSLHLQALENYIEQVLKLNVVSSESLGEEQTFKESFRIIAEKNDVKYTFESDFYNFNEIASREDLLNLKKIEGKEGELEVNEIFYMVETNDESNQNNKYITHSLKQLLEGEVVDHELELAIELLKDKFEGKFNYTYKDEKIGNMDSFVINLNDEIIITTGFSNTVQVEFKNKEFNFVQIIYRKVEKENLERKIENLYRLIEQYFNWNIIIENHNLSELYDYLVENVYGTEVYTHSLIRAQDVKDLNSESLLLFRNIIIGEIGSHKQISLTINYNKGLELVANYLFKEEVIVCNNVNEVKKTIEQMKEWIK